MVRIDLARRQHLKYYQVYSDIKNVHPAIVTENIGLPSSYYLKYSSLYIETVQQYT